MKTRAAVAEGPGQPFQLSELQIDEPRSDEILVRVKAVGLCHTDITMKMMLPEEMFPRVFGHEGAGVVEAVGADVQGVKVGDHVVMSFRSCRECERCQAGAVGYCRQAMALNYLGYRSDGSTTFHRDGAAVAGSFFGQSSFSELAIASPDNVVVVDPDVDLLTAAPFGCGFQTGAGAVLNTIDPDPASSLVVYGAGAVGLSAVAAARARRVQTIIAVDTKDSRLEAAAGLGAVGVNPSELPDGSFVERIRELTGGGAAAGVDTTAVPQVIKQAVRALAPRGTLVVVGLGAPEIELDAVDLMQNGKIVRGCIEGDSDPKTMIPELLGMYRAGDLPLGSLVTTYRFDQINEAVEDVEAGKVVKPVLVF
ncbi:NAD(P)-dependent alcohol dehydrogenase [uncultured Dietzia sp.]|uniref:NAD(P)-dependent alcohol dehydrogenase n=1 Tax=uncultured Dietzia sp. TaxID=395519 RepID=UPI0025D8579E|nr:NAD(P)-dependent alcohol dehydrogenase [uncultured Dietzia sp.]